jgi:formylglycine-generating enzyme required for sulfatase activity
VAFGRRLAIVGIAAALIAILFFAVILFRSDADSEALHVERQETELVVTDLANSISALYRAGKNLSDTILISTFADTSIWLQPANYFLKNSQSNRVTFAAVPVIGYRRGPDEGGSFNVTIRSLPDDTPPRLLENYGGFRYIPSGTFLLGDRLNPREPHFVWLTGYFMAEFEVTNAEFREFLADPEGYMSESNWTVAGWQWRMIRSSSNTAALKPGHTTYERFGQADQPVTWVTWYEANAFCKWMTRKVGGGRWLFTLPADAEWEKAARGPDNFDYGLGMTISDDEIKLYNWKKNPWEDTTVAGYATTRSHYQPNRYGLYHMTGNALEWTQSIDRPYSKGKPYTEDERNHDATVGSRTARGGSWYSASTAYLYIPYRDAFQPEHSSQELGFRIMARILP